MTLHEMISGFKYRFDITLYLQHVSDTIQHIHSLGLVHCDIKPKNISVDLQRRRYILGDLDLTHLEGEAMYLNYGIPSWDPLFSNTNFVALRITDLNGLAMLRTWLEEKANYSPLGSVDDEKEDWTANVLKRARK
jgi:serine/threonine protein kinase